MQLALKVELICARTNANEREGHPGLQNCSRGWCEGIDVKA